MCKVKGKMISVVLAIVLVCSVLPISYANEETGEIGLGNFTKKISYEAGLFTDFLSSDWYASNVITAYELGLVK